MRKLLLLLLLVGIPFLMSAQNDLIVTIKLDSIWCDLEKRGSEELTYSIGDNKKTIIADSVYYVKKEFWKRPKYHNKTFIVEPRPNENGKSWSLASSSDTGYSDLIVKTNLDSVFCKLNAVTSTGFIRYSVQVQGEELAYNIDQREVFYAIVGYSEDQKTQLSDSGVADDRLRYFNTHFDYADAYYLKTGSLPRVDDPHFEIVVAGNTARTRPNLHTETWRTSAGGSLKAAGALMLTSVALSALSAVLYSSSRVPVGVGHIVTGASGVSMVVSFGFVFAAGKSLKGR